MVKKLQYHEKKLLLKVNFLEWKKDKKNRDLLVVRKYHLQDREEYFNYNKLCGEIRKLSYELSLLDSKDAFRIQYEKLLINKFYSMGILASKLKFSDLENKITVSAFCRRRLSYVMFKNKMAQTVKDAVKFIEQGHVRIGIDLITDPAFLVTRDMEDYLTWTNTSKIKKNILIYNNKLDDFDM